MRIVLARSRILTQQLPSTATTAGTQDSIVEAENTKVTKYLYDGLNVIIERDWNNVTEARYTRGLATAGDRQHRQRRAAGPKPVEQHRHDIITTTASGR